ncbi:MAG: hypothetical protein JHC38_10860 [Thiotrichales bacterium]|nr:hypothetical protein [Thiotrichales bacterium]
MSELIDAVGELKSRGIYVEFHEHWSFCRTWLGGLKTKQHAKEFVNMIKAYYEVADAFGYEVEVSWNHITMHSRPRFISDESNKIRSKDLAEYRQRFCSASLNETLPDLYYSIEHTACTIIQALPYRRASLVSSSSVRLHGDYLVRQITYGCTKTLARDIVHDIKSVGLPDGMELVFISHFSSIVGNLVLPVVNFDNPKFADGFNIVELKRVKQNSSRQKKDPILGSENLN